MLHLRINDARFILCLDKLTEFRIIFALKLWLKQSIPVIIGSKHRASPLINITSQHAPLTL